MKKLERLVQENFPGNKVDIQLTADGSLYVTVDTNTVMFKMQTDIEMKLQLFNGVEVENKLVDEVTNEINNLLSERV